MVEAAGSRVTEVRITRLSDAVFYACVVVPGPGGPREVDARPSDAVNLAVACGVPILLNSELFEIVCPPGEPVALTAATAQIAAETRERMTAARRGLGEPPAAEAGGTGA
jgi:hypothetical protein